VGEAQRAEAWGQKGQKRGRNGREGRVIVEGVVPPPQQLGGPWGVGEPGQQAILWQFKVKKAGLVMQFQEFVGNKYYYFNK